MAFQFNNQGINPTSILSGSSASFLSSSDPNDFTLIGINDNPLEFNLNKNKSASRSDDKDDSSGSPSDKRERRSRREREHRDADKGKDDSDSNLSNSQDVVTLQNGPTLGPNMWSGMMNMGYPMVGMNMIVDPNMMSMNNYGYRIRIGSNTDAPNTGRLHVDYAQARDDQYEWECRQRQLQREQRHRERMEEERLRPPSPPPVVHYTDHEAASVAEKLKLDETFTKAVQILLTWLERGDCSKRNSNTFYSMIQSTNSHVRRLLTEKTQYEDELQKAKEIMKGRMQGILLQFSQIERVFLAACHKKVWDHFTKAQRKNIELWKKQSMELKNIQLDDEPQFERADDEMEVSDGEESSRKRPRVDTHYEERNSLREENDNLRCQMEAYKNEVEVIKVDLKRELEEKDKQFKMLQHTLQGMQQQLIDAKRKQSEEECKAKDLQTKIQQLSEAKTKTSSERDIVNLDDSEPEQSEASVCDAASDIVVVSVPPLNERDARLVGIISTFLNVHPFGAGLDYIWSYVSKLESNLKPSDIEVLMTRFPTVFKQELMGIGANIERRWLFNAFSSTN
ncbi:ecto-NOX disulfide-thiol exchanger 2 isoform X2 [Photinus pyralis]|uniref:ecto-NOX disulfide-thiol exchanger 2 isoform X2 n=1 Tax=Photinus pyralis TaxID=7054 RepID=UPI0012674814|nr:ecto-NOX disulfide-thiol exchanger 2 isoform X2 [Photinus pyralis]